MSSKERDQSQVGLLSSTSSLSILFFIFPFEFSIPFSTSPAISFISYYLFESSSPSIIFTIYFLSMLYLASFVIIIH